MAISKIPTATTIPLEPIVVIHPVIDAVPDVFETSPRWLLVGKFVLHMPEEAFLRRDMD